MWRDEGESGGAFIRAFTETAEAQARDTFAGIVSKASSIPVYRCRRRRRTGRQTNSVLFCRRRKRRRAGGGTRSQVHPSRAPPRAAHALEVARHLAPSSVSFCCSAKPTAARVGHFHPFVFLACKLLKVGRALRYSLSAVRCLAAALFPSSNYMCAC